VCGILGLLGGFGIRRRSGIRAATMLVTGMAGTVLFVSAMFEFSWRYQLPALVLLPLAGVLGLTVLIGPLRRPGSKSRRRMLAPYPDAVDWRALGEFTERHGQPAFAPVLVVIAAYNEEGGIGGVLDNLPEQCLGLDVDVLVVVDGCSDGTADEAIAHGAYTCVAPVNRGQGAALRLGYHLAAHGGARYVITTDADGQYDNAEMPLLLKPLVDGTHDFVTGSRRLGAAPSDDRVRWLGVRVYAALASLLTWRKITDTSFGFRGMRTELACAIPLRQPQYQASELLLGALAGGARLLEQPMTMRVRSAGTTKKGNNFVYGVRYGSVMTWTWLREFVWRRSLRLVGIGRRPADAEVARQPVGR
jgi:Glycosyl transferase family 2